MSGRHIIPENYPTRVLAVDPGVTTGWAALLIDVAGNLHLRTGVVKIPNIVAEADNLTGRYKPQNIVVERLPLHLDPVMQTVHALTYAAFPKRREIGPGEWKPVTGHLSLPDPPRPVASYTIHERDAYRLGVYYVWNYLGQRPSIATPYVRLRPRKTAYQPNGKTETTT
jgi:hypothetical protein